MRLRSLISAAETIASETVIAKLLPNSVMFLSVIISPSEILACITPVVLAARILNCSTVINPVTAIVSFPKPLIDPARFAA